MHQSLETVMLSAVCNSLYNTTNGTHQEIEGVYTGSTYTIAAHGPIRAFPPAISVLISLKPLLLMPTVIKIHFYMEVEN